MGGHGAGAGVQFPAALIRMAFPDEVVSKLETNYQQGLRKKYSDDLKAAVEVVAIIQCDRVGGKYLHEAIQQREEIS